MSWSMIVSLMGLVLGLMVVAANPSPFFGALGLVVVAGMGCGILTEQGGPFLALILFLIYLGGMLVVFGFSAALAAEPHPETLGNRWVMFYLAAYAVGLSLITAVFWGMWHWEYCIPSEEATGFGLSRGDTGGVALMYASGGGMLVVSAGVLLLTLFVVLELTRGLNRGALRAV
uniref:NADH-ubiquinone oxidoreductase chain 6 n=1 Tax=Mullus surmuletus TaxID=87757 RepID=A0A7G9M2W8_MULSU|nr:NADH dehydrogenase subunit 6 [Mullus surmuletus]QNM99686.1 NADH dehydrogenase subunit 6 [Mullus surmuletus]